MENRREYIPGCERYTLASEIDSLKKYLKRGIENRDENLDLPVTNLGTPVDQKLGKITDLSGRREDLTIGKGTTELPKTREKLEIGPGPEVLPGSRESLETQGGPETLPKGRETLEDSSPDLTELPGSRETLTDTSPGITELPAGTAVSLPESVPASSGGDSSAEITSLSGESDRIGLDVPESPITLGTTREPLEGTKDIPLDKSRESLEVKAGPGKLPKESEKLDVPGGPVSLPKTRESLETPAGPGLEKSRESLEVPGNPVLETDRAELEIPGGPELDKSREGLEVGQTPELSKSRESLEVPGNPELSDSREPLEALKNVPLEKSREPLEGAKDIPLDKSREPLEGAKSIPLEKSRETLEALKSVPLEKSRETLEVTKKNSLDNTREPLDTIPKVTKLPTSQESLEVPGTPSLPDDREELEAPGVQGLPDSRESLEVQGSPELRTGRLELESPGSPDLRDTRESLAVQESTELEDGTEKLPGNIPEPDLPGDAIGISVPGAPSLPEDSEKLQDTRNISLPESREEITDSSEVELGTEALGLEVPENPGLSDKSETLEVPGSPDLETDRVELLDDSWQEELISGLTEPQQIKKPDFSEDLQVVEGLQDYQKISDLTQIKALIPGLKDSQKLVDDSWEEELSDRREDLEDTSWTEELVTGLTEPQELNDDSWTEKLVEGLEKEQELLDDSWTEQLVSGYRKDPDQELLDDSWAEELVSGYRKDPDQELLDDSWQEKLVEGYRKDPDQELLDDSWKEELVDSYRKDPGQELNDDSWKEELVEGLEKEQKLIDKSWEKDKTKEDMNDYIHSNLDSIRDDVWQNGDYYIDAEEKKVWIDNKRDKEDFNEYLHSNLDTIRDEVWQNGDYYLDSDGKKVWIDHKRDDKDDMNEYLYSNFDTIRDDVWQNGDYFIDSKGEKSWTDNKRNKDDLNKYSKSGVKTITDNSTTPGVSNYLEGIPAYKLDGNFASYLNPSKYIRWAVEQTVGLADVTSPEKIIGKDIIKGSIKQKLLDETLHALVAARDLAEKSLGLHRYRLPGGDRDEINNLVRQSTSGDLSLNAITNIAQDTVSNMLSSAAVRVDKPINRPNPNKSKDAPDVFETLEGPRHFKILRNTASPTVTEINGFQKAIGSNHGLHEYTPFYYIDTDSSELSEALEHIGHSNRLGLGGTLEALCGQKDIEIKSFDQLKELLENSPYITTASRGIGKRSSDGNSYAVNTMTLDSNHVWEIIFEPYCGPENGGMSYLPSIHQINYENYKGFGYNTSWDTWVPFTSFELTSKKMVQKSINLYSGEISIPQNLEFTNELRLVICDDQYKSWKRYFDYVIYASSYYTVAHNSEYYLKKCTEKKITFYEEDLSKYSKGVIRPAPYKNLAFRCKILCMNPQYQTLNVSDLLVVLKEFTEEWQGEVDASPTELAVMFSVVGENPNSLTAADKTNFALQSAKEDNDYYTKNSNLTQASIDNDLKNKKIHIDTTGGTVLK